jgi:D-lactate dehydrogenase
LQHYSLQFILAGNYQLLFQNLKSSIDSTQIIHDPLYTLAFGTDASFYRLIPKMMIKAKNKEEVSLILKESSKLDIPVTFRAAEPAKWPCLSFTTNP